MFYKSKLRTLFAMPIFILTEVALFAFTIFSNLNDVNSSLRLFVYIFPFIIFFEGLYFWDKEFNYAQIIKIALLAFVCTHIKCNVMFVFSLCVWGCSLLQYNFIRKIQYEEAWKENKKDKSFYIIVFINTVVFLFAIYSHRKWLQHTITEDKISNITSWVITFISTDLIFNFTAMFILLQENYSKYNSIFLLKNIVGYRTIVSVAVVPGTMIVLLCLGVISSVYFLSFAVFCILYCLFCSISLLQKLKKVIADTELLHLLMSRTSEQMFYWYKTNQLTASENNIDTILRITTNAIVNKQTDTLPDVLGIVLEWLDDNKELIADKHHSNNRFYYFMNVITDSLISVNSPIVVLLYAEQLFGIFKNELEKNPFDYKDVDFKNRIKDMHLFYYSLFRLIAHYINANDKEYDDILLRLTGVFGFNVEENFLTLEPSERRGLHVYESADFRDFDFYYFEFYKKIIDAAIKAENFSYLKHLYLFTRFYRLEEAELNNNHLQLLHKLTYAYSKILKACNYNDEIVFSTLREYQSLQHYLSYQSASQTLFELLGNVIYNSLREIYFDMLRHKVRFSERHFNPLYRFYWDSRKHVHKDVRFLNLFCFVIKSYFVYADMEGNSVSINRIWGRLEQLGEIFIKSQKTELYDIFHKNKIEILKMYPLVQEKYDNYRAALEEEASELQKAMREFS